MLVNPITNFTNYRSNYIYTHTSSMPDVRIIPKFCIKEIYILKMLLKLCKPF